MGLTDLLTRRKDRTPVKPTSRDNSPNLSPTLPLRSFSPLSMNLMNTRSTSSPDSAKGMRASNGANGGTIRSVPSESQQLESRSPFAGLDKSLGRSGSPVSSSQTVPHIAGKPPSTWRNEPQQAQQLAVESGLVRKLSSEFGPSKLYAGAVHVVESATTGSNGDSVHEPGGGGQCTCGHVCGRGVGGAKSTSSFIEKVMGEREFYKRELEAERFKTQEANDALGFTKARMEKLISDHETEMHEANMNRTLLKRKERQLEDMKGKIDIEKQRALAASEQEKIWKRDMDLMEEKCRKKVEEAEAYAAMVEAQNNTMIRHWKKKQADLDKREAAMLKTHEEFLQLVRKESEKSKRVMAICDQYRAENERLVIINQELKESHETYKTTNEESLRGIKRQAVEFDEKADLLLSETTELRDKLKWSLQVSKGFRDLPSAVDMLP